MHIELNIIYSQQAKAAIDMFRVSGTTISFCKVG